MKGGIEGDVNEGESKTMPPQTHMYNEMSYIKEEPPRKDIVFPLVSFCPFLIVSVITHYYT